MAESLPEAVARGAARQVYRLLRLSAPLLRPIYRQIGLEQRARAVTALVRIGWNGTPVKVPVPSELAIAAPATLRPGVACIGHPSAESGVGEALRATAKGFAATGVPFTLVGLETYTTARLGDDSMARHASSCLDRRVNLLCDGIVGAEIALAALGPEALTGRVTILRPFWELAKVPDRFAPLLGTVQEIWAPSEFVRAAFAAAVEVPVLRVPVPVELGQVARVERASLSLPDAATLFLFAFDPCSFFVRKNPLGVIEAFKRAFPSKSADVGLVIKTLHAGPHAHSLNKIKAAIAGDERIHLIERTMSRAEMNGLLSASDAYVSLHRSEGFGFGLAEAMALDKPVVGTAYSGTADFLTPETGYPVPFTLVPVHAGEYPDHDGQVWAEPDLDVAAERMRAIVEDPAEARRLARAGQAFIKTHYSAAAAGKLMRDRLEALGLLRSGTSVPAFLGE
ncbi:MAG: glycosyltransferase family 4 protein [Methyloceanibacter sp.]